MKRALQLPKPTNAPSGRLLTFLPSLLAAALLMAACGDSGSQTPRAQSPTPRGEPIVQGEPIVSAAPPGNPAPLAPTDVVTNWPAPTVSAIEPNTGTPTASQPAAETNLLTATAAVTAGAGAAFATATNRAALPLGAGGTNVAAITFDQLASFVYVIPDEELGGAPTNAPAVKPPDQIPDRIKALDQLRVSLKGFMLPLKVEQGLVTELLIMRDQSMCCYGRTPKINEWVSVKMSEKGVKAVMDQAVTLVGKIHVGEMRENGYLVGIYRMDGETLLDPEP